MSAADSFPRHSARTQGFTLGAPRNFTVADDGRLVLFLRSGGGTDRSNALWALRTDHGTSRCMADPQRLRDSDNVSAEEQARRERARERATGITGYATDASARTVAFTISGEVFVADTETDTLREIPARSPAADPRPSPDGSRIAYTNAGMLRLVNADGSNDRPLAEPEHPSIRWGVAEFIAAEEMNRGRGYWWSPDGTAILAAKVDESPVAQWHLADPTHPATPPRTMRYPSAGTANAEVELALIPVDEPRSRCAVRWDRQTYPYLVAAQWSAYGSPLIAVQSRDQRVQLVLAVDPDTGGTSELARETDPHWVEIKNGWPAWTPDGALVRVSARDDSYRLLVDGRPWTEPGLQVRAVLDVAESDILVLASEDDPTRVHVYRAGPDGSQRLSPAEGVHTAARGGDVTVFVSSDRRRLHAEVRVMRAGEHVTEIESLADDAELRPRVELLRTGARQLCSALLLPTDYTPDQGALPVLLDPYGGPQAQRVLDRQQGYLTAQWFADRGFAVLITDGRGTGGRGPEWDRAIAGDLAEPPLRDQVDALHAVAEQRTELDLDRVGIRGWSFGGYLAALAVLRRPDVFHAAIAGAPVCDWRLYDTHYTERYLGDPIAHPETYDENSLLESAALLDRPLLLVHGMVDDNVVPAHSLRFSEALTASARPHTLLPLPGVSHMPTSETTTENLLLIQLEFLRRNLAGR